jgi:hypothetical protein
MPTGGVGEFLVLRDEEGRYFREYLPSKSKPEFRFVKHLAVARGFQNQVLAESFQRFLAVNGHPTTIFVTEKNRLLKLYEPKPYPLRESGQPPKLSLVNLKKDLRDFRT